MDYHTAECTSIVCQTKRVFDIQVDTKWSGGGESYMIATYLTTDQRKLWTSIADVLEACESSMSAITGKWTMQINNLTQYSTYEQDKDKPIFPQAEVYEMFMIPIFITYPMKNPVVVIIELPGEVTLRQFIYLLYKIYSEIYKLENRTSIIAEDRHPQFKFNRNTTDGVMGIYGHYLTDIKYEGIRTDLAMRAVVPYIGS